MNAARFLLPCCITKSGAFYLAVRHPEGIAWIRGSDARPSYDVALQPWGTIEGTFRIDSKPAPDVLIHFEHMRASDGEPMITVFNSIQKTDADGRFVFKRVPAGQALLARIINGGAGEYTQVTSLTVPPAKTTEITFGGDGCTITGIAALHGVRGQSTADQGLRVSICARPQSGNDTFYGTVNPNGTFRIDDVPAGNYLLTLRYSKRKPGGSLSDRIDVGTAQKQLLIPRTTGVLLDLGRVEADHK